MFWAARSCCEQKQITDTVPGLENVLEKQGKDGFFGMESIFGLIPDNAMRAFDDSVGDFFISMGWETVHHYTVGGCKFDQGFVYLIIR